MSWVRALADQLCEHSQAFAPQGRIVAFCRDDDGNRTEFRTNELLFDILIAETCIVQAAGGKDLRALTRALWVVESELKQSDSRDVLIDLNKLVIAKSINKVLVISAETPLVAWAQVVMKRLLDPNESNIFLVTIPHPSDWCEPLQASGAVYQLSNQALWLTHPLSAEVQSTSPPEA